MPSRLTEGRFSRYEETEEADAPAAPRVAAADREAEEEEVEVEGEEEEVVVVVEEEAVVEDEGWRCNLWEPYFAEWERIRDPPMVLCRKGWSKSSGSFAAFPVPRMAGVWVESRESGCLRSGWR